MADLPSPLTDEHLQQIKDALDVVRFGEQQIQKATAAGIDVTKMASDLADAKQKLLQIKQAYFPGR